MSRPVAVVHEPQFAITNSRAATRRTTGICQESAQPLKKRQSDAASRMQVQATSWTQHLPHTINHPITNRCARPTRRRRSTSCGATIPIASNPAAQGRRRPKRAGISPIAFNQGAPVRRPPSPAICTGMCRVQQRNRRSRTPWTRRTRMRNPPLRTRMLNPPRRPRSSSRHPRCRRSKPPRLHRTLMHRPRLQRRRMARARRHRLPLGRSRSLPPPMRSSTS